MNSKSVRLNWRPSAEPRGIITGYNVSISEMESGELFRIDAFEVVSTDLIVLFKQWVIFLF